MLRVDPPSPPIHQGETLIYQGFTLGYEVNKKGPGEHVLLGLPFR